MPVGGHASDIRVHGMSVECGDVQRAGAGIAGGSFGAIDPVIELFTIGHHEYQVGSQGLAYTAVV